MNILCIKKIIIKFIPNKEESFIMYEWIKKKEKWFLINQEVSKGIERIFIYEKI